MGGMGSGRRASYCGRDTTDDSMPLDIRRLHRASALLPGRSVGWEWTVNDRVIGSIRVHTGDEAVTLVYNYTPPGRPAEVVRQPVTLTTTPCALGGRRTWFACPACGKRVAVIYGAGRLFACRQCKGLAYSSQGEADDDRAARRADRIRKRLGWEPGILNGNGWKPKGMHWRTFERLRGEHDIHVNAALAGMAAKLDLLQDRFGKIDAEIDRWHPD
jgi:hypothetical protein